jgi:hypothetical protein
MAKEGWYILPETRVSRGTSAVSRAGGLGSDESTAMTPFRCVARN